MVSSCSSDTAHKMIQFIADTIREKLCTILCSANAFSLMSDGSQAGKTKSEKELVFARVIVNGTGTYYNLALQNIDSFGDANAAVLKTAFDDVFKNKIKMYATADGASVNFGKYNGLMVYFKNDGKPWLVDIH